MRITSALVSNHDRFGRDIFESNLPAAVSRARPEVDDPIGVRHHRLVVLDHDDGLSGVDQTVQEAEQLFEIGTIGLTPMVQGVVVTNSKFRNVPATLGNDWPLRSPGNARTEQFFFASK